MFSKRLNSLGNFADMAPIKSLTHPAFGDYHDFGGHHDDDLAKAFL